METQKQANWMPRVVAIGGVVVALVLVFGSWFVGQSAQTATEDAVHAISSFYLDELTGRREQVVETSLESNVRNAQTAVSLMTGEDLSDIQHLQAFQARMKKLYTLDKFAFVDSNGLIYTSRGTLDNIADYDFDYKTIDSPAVSIKDIHSANKTVVIAIPVNDIPFNGQTLVACFMEMNMDDMLEGLSLQSDSNGATFCNLYTTEGDALTDMVLGGLAEEDNLLEAMKIAELDAGYTLESFTDEFKSGKPGMVSFTYNGVKETLDYVPVPNTNWMVTYLVRENVITDQVSGITTGITLRSTVQTVLTALVFLAVFLVLLAVGRRNNQMALERETEEAANRVKQEEMERQIALQEQIIEQERQRAQQDKMITALASDYRSVYYVDLEANESICYQADENLPKSHQVGESFPFIERFTEYANDFVVESHRKGFLEFIDPDNIRAKLADCLIISHRYLIERNGEQKYEMLRMAGVRHADHRDDGIVHAVGVGFADVDDETREAIARRQALSDALAAAEEANKAKTAFLSNMSHEIRTPMNAIIGLDTIALNDPDLSASTREHLEKIGGSAKHLLGLINDILDVSRIESGRMTLKSERFSFSKLLEQVNTIISGQCNDKGLEYKCSVNGRIDDYYIGDDMKLRQTLINILGNSVKFTPEGGSVELNVERTAQFDGRSTLRFSMSDTGIGMSKEFIPKLFETFSQEDSSTTSKYGSTGLGMAITKSIVEMMNGNIEVESEKGVGTTFIVTVTLMDSTENEGGIGDANVNPEDLNVLVIDDDPVACEHAKLVLETAGIASETALSGQEAVDMVRLRHARHEPFNLILVDWKMPDMDGIETTRQIRDLVGNESAIIILTAYNWDDIIEEATSVGVDSFLAKPLFASNVMDEFHQAFLKKNPITANDANRADLTGRRVLLAEDVEINAEILIELVSIRDIVVEHAENGQIAVDMFTEHEPGYYDAVLMDMRMPVMDGLTATTTIRALDREDAKTIPIIALTANAFDEDVQQSLQAGLNAHLSKPVDPDILFDTLETLIKD